MTKRKHTKTYLFTVEGETEKWYFERLQHLINNDLNSSYTVSLKVAIQKNPLKYVKGLRNIYKTVIYHFCDYESNEQCHVDQFKKTIDMLKEAKKLGKQIDYKLCYSNFTFDLWILLHKYDAKSSIIHRRNYLELLNRAYDKRFENMDSYKSEENFKRILSRLNLSDVIEAVKRAKFIMQENKNRGYTLHQYKGYKFYKENPSLMVWEAIEKILKDCNLYT
ncbi:MAG: RloB family protein [Chitinispirillales bacterium]|jgi:hypothetical protein|nr:RloB family protein [Chitinispirillales bacterium]